jgi:hypothetical protein
MRSLIFLLAVLLLSCETTVDPRLPDNGSGLVIYSFFRPGSPLRIDAFNTVPVLQTETIQRNSDLTIRLLENGVLVEEVTANQQGAYISNTVPAEQNSYRFETAMGKQLFSATSSIPAPVSIAGAKLSDEVEYINSDEYGYPAEITLTDPHEAANFYALEILVQNCSRGDCTEGDLQGNLNEVLVEELKVNTSGNTDVDIVGGPQQIDGLKYIYFSDEGFDGETVTLKFFIIPALIDLRKRQYIKFVLKSITREYYGYLRTSDFQQQMEEDGTLAEPVQIATNIENGLGTFAGYNFSVYTIKR